MRIFSGPWTKKGATEILDNSQAHSIGRIKNAFELLIHRLQELYTHDRELLKQTITDADILEKKQFSVILKKEKDFLEEKLARTDPYIKETVPDYDDVQGTDGGGFVFFGSTEQERSNPEHDTITNSICYINELLLLVNDLS